MIQKDYQEEQKAQPSKKVPFVPPLRIGPLRDISFQGIQLHGLSPGKQNNNNRSENQIQDNSCDRSDSSSCSFVMGIDFTFNLIKDVQKHPLDLKAQWYVIPADGFQWVTTCHNNKLCRTEAQIAEIKQIYGPDANRKTHAKKHKFKFKARSDQNYVCPLFDQFQFIQRGYDIFSLKKDAAEGKLRCQVCKSAQTKVRNCAFLNADWSIKATLKSNKNSNIADANRTYDQSLYMLRDISYDFQKIFLSLDILVKAIDCGSKQPFQNLPNESVSESEFEESKDSRGRSKRKQDSMSVPKNSSIKQLSQFNN